MIQKIQNGEYLKRLDNMSAVEKSDYLARVGEWQKKQAPLLMPKTEEDIARFQNIIQCSASWNDAECVACEEGVRLLTALAPAADTWLPDMLYVKSAKRAVKRMTELLAGTAAGDHEADASDTAADGTAEIPEDQVARSGKVQKKDSFRKLTDGDINSKSQDGQAQVDAVPVRPKHIDQYVHLLPKKTQEKAATVRGLLRDLDAARENARRLMNANEQGDKIAQWASAAQKIDKKVKGIYKELDDEWEKLVKEGRVVIDDLGNARVIPDTDASDTVASELTSEQKARRRELRKWLVDTRRGNGNTRNEYVEKWKNNFKEYLTMEGDKAFKDEKILEAMKHYGIKNTK